MPYPRFDAMYRALLPDGGDPEKAVNARAAFEEFRRARAEKLEKMKHLAG